MSEERRGAPHPKDAPPHPKDASPHPSLPTANPPSPEGVEERTSDARPYEQNCNDTVGADAYIRPQHEVTNQ